MILEGVTVCINYADYLATTLPINRDCFDRLVVATDPADQDTIDLAHQYGCDIVPVLRYRENGDVFNRGKALNDGLAVCTRHDWLCIFDSDIVFPDLRPVIFPLSSFYRPGTIYGMERVMCGSYVEWQAYLQHRDLSVFSREDAGYPCRVFPVGFFQLWRDSGKKMDYPETFPTASDSDIEFSQLFAYHRHLSAQCIHLSAEPWQHGTNYSGRISKPWGQGT